MKRAGGGVRVAPGWGWRFPLMMAVIAGFFAASATAVGYVLGHVSDWIGGL